MRTLLSSSLLCLLALFCCTSATWGGDDPPAKQPPLTTTGALSLVGEDFYELSYRVQVKGKKKPQPAKAYLKVAEDTEWLADAPLPLAKFAEGTEVWLYGTPVESESVDQNGQTVIDRQVRGVLAVVSGEGLSLKAGKVERGPRWVEASVSKAGPVLQVSYKGEDYRVLAVRASKGLVRTKLPKRPAKLKKKFQATVVGESSSERPAKGKDKITNSFKATSVVILDKRVGAVYQLMQKP